MTADARRRAEEALAEYDRLWGAAHATNAYGRAVVGLASALRALLAAGPEAPPPPCDAVREAAERLRRARESNFLTCTDSRVRAEGNRVLLLEVDAILATLATVTAPDDAAVREAAEALTVYCDVCEADRREPCHTVTTGDPAPYPHPERAVAAALAARGGE